MAGNGLLTFGLGGDSGSPLLTAGLLPAAAGSVGLIATNLADLLVAVHDRLVGDGVFGPDLCWIGLDPEPPPLAGGPFGVVMPGGQAPLQGQVDGAGRWVSGMVGSVTVHVGDRSIRDVVGQDSSRLFDINQGLDITAHAVIRSLLLPPADLTDIYGNVLTEEPCRLTGMGQPRTFARDRDRTWAGISLDFEVRYMLALTPETTP